MMLWWTFLYLYLYYFLVWCYRLVSCPLFLQLHKLCFPSELPICQCLFSPQSFTSTIMMNLRWKPICKYVIVRCVCVCVCLRQLTMKTSSVWIRWDTRERINDVMLKMVISYATSLQCYFRIHHLTFLTSHFILFAQLETARVTT